MVWSMTRTMMRPVHVNRGLRRLLIGGVSVIWAMVSLTTASHAFVLVTPEEVAREQAKGQPPLARSLIKRDTGGPEIVLVSPPSLENILSPLDIELRFLPKAPSKIARDSLRVLYGFFEFNVTDRLTGHAEVTPSGILAKDAVLPAGSHSITIEISDDLDRISRKTFLFEVKDK